MPSPQGEGQQTRVSDRIEFANSLRGLAAVTVVIGHHLAAFWIYQDITASLTGMPAVSFTPPWFAVVLTSIPISFASFGVGLFFIISGFVIPFSLMRYNGRAFLTGRLLRIYPTYWVGFSVSVAALVAGNWMTGTPLQFSADHVLLHYLPPLRAILWSKPIDGIIWTLEIELFFYLLCALLAGAIGRGDRRVRLVPFALFALWLPVWSFAAHPPTGFERLAHRLEFIAIYLPFLIFMFIGVALNFRQRGLIDRRQAGNRIAACVAMFLCAWATEFIGHGWAPLFVGIIEPGSYLWALALFVWAMARQERFRGGPVFHFLSDISYPLYVVHGMMGFVLLQLLMARRFEAHVALGLTLVAIFAAAWAIHRFVETPTHRLGQRLARAIMRKREARTIS